MPKRKDAIIEKRKYIRLDSVFPVEFRLMGLDGETFFSTWLQGFTSNISKGGICLEVNRLPVELAGLIRDKQVEFYLHTELPFNRGEVNSRAKVAWINEAPEKPGKYFIGLSYKSIDPRQNNIVMRYVHLKRAFIPFVLSTVFILGLGVGVASYLNLKLIQANKALVEQLVNIIQESSLAKQKIKQINREKEALKLRLQALQLSIQTIDEERQKTKEEAKKAEALNAQIASLIQEKNVLQEQLLNLQYREDKITEDLLRLDERKLALEKANADKMYQWLKMLQHPRTGLLVSFVSDAHADTLAFTYDQALAAQVFTNFSDFSRAKQILDFFFTQAKRKDRLFLRSYYAYDGSLGEYSLQSGPNIWLGIAVIQYTKKSQDRSFLGLAEMIAEEMVNLQSQNADGGIRRFIYGSEEYFVEDNLDAYAFFNMFYELTGELWLQQAKDKAVAWFLQYIRAACDSEDTQKLCQVVVNNSCAWSIVCVGPEKLAELGLNPDLIMEFAQERCAAQASFLRPEGKGVKINGFTSGVSQKRAAEAVVSAEQTARMILAFQIMSDYYYEKGMLAKSRACNLKASEYLGELGKMIIPNPSPSSLGESCLVYATQDNVDTGKGWMAPAGKPVASVAATAYMLCAYYRYNPLQLEK